MADAKIEIKVGQIEFSGEGEQDWVAKQLDKILAKAEDLITLAAPPEQPDPQQPDPEQQHKPMAADSGIAKKTLPSFLTEKQATSNQVQKFLVTAVWLEAKAKTRISTSEVSKALKDSQQSRLSNPSKCLNRNVGKGFCEKDGKKFFVTQEGKASI